MSLLSFSLRGFLLLTILFQTLAGYQQQDAHEYYQFLVDKLHSSADGHVDGNDRPCNCFFHKAFYGKLRSSVTCGHCGNITRTEEPMVDLSLDVQAKKRSMKGSSPTTSSTLTGCLKSFTSPEKLMAGVYKCSGCGSTQYKATKQLRIKKLPAILCMQIKVRGICILLPFFFFFFFFFLNTYADLTLSSVTRALFPFPKK